MPMVHAIAKGALNGCSKAHLLACHAKGLLREDYDGEKHPD